MRWTRCQWLCQLSGKLAAKTSALASHARSWRDSVRRVSTPAVALPGLAPAIDISALVLFLTAMHLRLPPASKHLFCLRPLLNSISRCPSSKTLNSELRAFAARLPHQRHCFTSVAMPPKQSTLGYVKPSQRTLGHAFLRLVLPMISTPSANTVQVVLWCQDRAPPIDSCLLYQNQEQEHQVQRPSER